MARATSKSRKKSRTRPQSRQARQTAPMVFTRKNYVILVASVALVVVGYVVMRLDNQVESFLSLYLAPLMILGGYLSVIWAILWRPKDEGKPPANPSAG